MIRIGPGRKLICIPDSGVTVLSPGGGAAAVDWWDPDGSIGAANVAGVWQAKGAASLAASYLRLAGTEGNANIDPAVVGSGVAPTWGASGWTFNGTTQYLNTGIVPAETWTMIIVFTNVTNNGYICGELGTEVSGNESFALAPNRDADAVRYLKNQAASSVSPKLLNGTLGIAYRTGYRNGVLDAINLSSWIPGTGPKAIFIGAINRIAGYLYCAAYIQAIAIYKVTITAPQVALVSAAMLAL